MAVLKHFVFVCIISMTIVADLLLSSASGQAAAQQAITPEKAQQMGSEVVGHGNVPVQAPPNWSPSIEKNLPVEIESQGARAVAMGDYAAAADIYRASRDRALANGQNAEGAEAAIRYAQTLEGWSSMDPSNSSRLEEARQAYEIAIQKGTPGQSALAKNNQAVLQLRSGKAAEAIATLTQIDPAYLPSSDQYLYHYNLARALELADQPSKSFVEYVTSARLRTGYDRGTSGAFRVLGAGHSFAIDLKDMAALVNSMIASGQSERAANQIFGLLLSSKPNPQSRNWLAFLLRCIAEAHPDAAGFAVTDWRQLVQLGQRRPELKAEIMQVQVAYDGDLWSEIDHRLAQDVFRSWAQTPLERQTMSFCLRRVGDSYARRDKPSEALARYYFSWDLDNENLESATYAAEMSHDPAIPKEQGRRLLDRLVTALFDRKFEAYQTGNWRDILRLHMVLAGIFQGADQWGSRSESHSVVFQLEHAAKAEQELRSHDPKLPPQPGIHAQLGEAYAHTGAMQESWNQFVLAATGYADEGKKKAAAESLDRARQMNILETPEMRLRFAGAEAKISAMGMA